MTSVTEFWQMKLRPMDIAKITVKGMVCDRCILSLRAGLERRGMLVNKIELGEVEVFRTPAFSPGQVTEAVTELGFQILTDRQSALVQKTKAIIEEALTTYTYASVKYSDLISDRTGISYDTVSGIFSASVGMTLEHYIINRKIEYVKTMLKGTKLSLTEISYQTNYSSVQHLSKQFKTITGINPSEYRLRHVAEKERERKAD